MKFAKDAIVACAIVASACAPVGHASVATDAQYGAVAAVGNGPAPDDPPIRAVIGDPLRCTQRVPIPAIADAFEADWSPDGRTLAVSRIVRIDSATTSTGYEEDQRIALLDLVTGTVTERGVGSEPAWSGSGAYLSYWHDEKTLFVIRSGTVLPIAVVRPTQPDIRWVGDELVYVSGWAIQSWSAAGTRVLAHVAVDAVPRYPREAISFSGDGARFVMTRYADDGSTARYLGTTSTGALDALDDGGATFVEWSPRGEDLLLRSPATLSVLDVVAGVRSLSFPTPVGTTHLWTADGRLLTGKISPTIPAGNVFDTFVERSTGAVATLPNLLGIRTFSPDGRYFAGVVRTGLYSTALELFRCGVAVGGDTDLVNDETVRTRAAAIAADERRFVRPASAAITQFRQGIHTGIDVAAPFGTVIVASDDGVVGAIGVVPVGGRRVCVTHAGGLESCDYHTALPLVAVGERVVRGQPVALMGLTGVTTGPHVHWEAKLDGVIVDPMER